MNKAFTKETDVADDADDVTLPPLPPGMRNYLTPQGYQRLRGELVQLLDVERPKVVEVVSWAAKNGDRSENGDYLYGKKRLREIDRRIRFLTKRLDVAEVTDPSAHHGNHQIFFGATVTYANAQGDERTVTIKGIDEADSLQGEVSWISPIARALLKAREGDEVQLVTSAGVETIDATSAQSLAESHAYYRENAAVMSDLHFLLNEGRSAAERPTLTRVDTEAGKYWKVIEDWSPE